METDLKSASLMLGKALENPAENFDALARIAKLKFTPEEKAALEAMQKTNGVAAAQAKILDILEKRNIRGTAKALADASSGFKIFMKSVDDLAEEFGRILFPYFKKFWEVLGNVMKRIAELSEPTKRLIIVIAGFAAAIPAAAAAIGGIGLAVTSATAAFGGLMTAMSAPILIATLSKFGVFALAVLAAAIAFLVLDDAIGFITGKKSTIGEVFENIDFWLGRWSEQINKSKGFKDFMGFFKMLDDLDHKFRVVENNVFEVIGNFFSGIGAKIAAAVESIKTTLSNFGQWANDFLMKHPILKGVFSTLLSPALATPEDYRNPNSVFYSPSTPGAGLAPSPSVVAGAQSNAVTVLVNQTLPPGTPEEHAAIVKQSTENLFELYMNKHLRDALANYPAQP
jgi:hypothetical protein